MNYFKLKISQVDSIPGVARRCARCHVPRRRASAIQRRRSPMNLCRTWAPRSRGEALGGRPRILNLYVGTWKNMPLVPLLRLPSSIWCQNEKLLRGEREPRRGWWWKLWWISFSCPWFLNCSSWSGLTHAQPHVILWIDRQLIFTSKYSWPFHIQIEGRFTHFGAERRTRSLKISNWRLKIDVRYVMNIASLLYLFININILLY